jgi:hypothetical protein
MSQEARAWVTAINNRSLVIDIGSPEGVVEAVQGAEYMDSDGTTGNIKYIKRDANILGDRSKGWILI